MILLSQWLKNRTIIFDLKNDLSRGRETTVTGANFISQDQTEVPPPVTPTLPPEGMSHSLSQILYLVPYTHGCMCFLF